MNAWLLISFVGLFTIALAGGCSPPIDDALGVPLEQVEAIRDNEDMTSAEKRVALENLGLTPRAINGVLVGERTANQYGGTLRSSYEKFVNGQLDELTPDELQLYSDTASEFDPQFGQDIGDADAAAIVQFFRDNGIQTRDDLAAFLDDPANVFELPEGYSVLEMSGLFVEFDLDQLIGDL